MLPEINFLKQTLRLDILLANFFAVQVSTFIKISSQRIVKSFMATFRFLASCNVGSDVPIFPSSKNPGPFLPCSLHFFGVFLVLPSTIFLQSQQLYLDEINLRVD